MGTFVASGSETSTLGRPCNRLQELRVGIFFVVLFCICPKSLLIFWCQSRVSEQAYIGSLLAPPCTSSSGFGARAHKSRSSILHLVPFSIFVVYGFVTSVAAGRSHVRQWC